MSKHNVSRDFVPFQCENGIVIPLTQHQFTIVDLQDEWVLQFNWYADWDKHVKSFYAKRAFIVNGKQITICLHREILKPDSLFEVDHIHHDTLDNRRCNLRIVTPSQNQMNRVKQTNNTSGIPGVYWHKRCNKWQALIMINNKQIHLGYFENFDDAVVSRKEAELKYYGKHRNDQNR